MVFPPELVEMVQELWDRGVALHPAVMVSFIYTYKLLTGCLGIMKAIIPRQPVNNSYIY